MSSVLKPLYAIDTSRKFRDHACVDIAALIGTPTHEAGAPFHTPVEAVPRPIGLTAYIAYLRQRNLHDLTVTDRDTVQYLPPKGEDVEYFVRRAEGGFGLLFSGGTSTDAEVDGTDTILNHKQEFIATGRELNTRLSAYGAKMFMQLSFNVGRNGGLKTPSPLPHLGNPTVTTEALTVQGIHHKVKSMVQAAGLCRDTGFAGMDIHAMHWGHLLDSFALSLMNYREDESGGCLTNRIRVAKEIVEAIKRECGEDFPVIMRLALKSYMKGFDKASYDGSEEAGRTVEEAIEIGKLLESYGYDALSTDAGTLDAFYYAMPPAYVKKAYTLDMAARLKAAVSIPVLCGARMADPDLDEQAIAEGKIYAVVIGRQAIADPDFVKKVASGESECVRTCIGCNQGYIWEYFTSGKVGCTVNPEVGHESYHRVTKAAEKKKVIIVGGGVTGMEAARTSKLRGHDVTLYEKSDVLGGNLIPAGAHDFKAEVADLCEYYKHQMELLDVEVRLHTPADAKLLRESGADAIILAVVSSPIMLRIEGIDHPKAVFGVDALLGKKAVGEKVVVVGGGLVGCEIALGYEQEGKEISIVEALDEIMKTGDVPGMNKTMLLDAFEYYGTEILTNTRLKTVNDDGALVLMADGAEQTIPADTVIMSVGYRPLPSARTKLAGCGAEIYEIGDGSKVGNVLTCIRDAYEVAHNL